MLLSVFWSASRSLQCARSVGPTMWMLCRRSGSFLRNVPTLGPVLITVCHVEPPNRTFILVLHKPPGDVTVALSTVFFPQLMVRFHKDLTGQRELLRLLTGKLNQ